MSAGKGRIIAPDFGAGPLRVPEEVQIVHRDDARG